jgi:hypothetical protein
LILIFDIPIFSNETISFEIMIVQIEKNMCYNPSLGLGKVQAKSEARESHFMLLGVWESVRE